MQLIKPTKKYQKSWNEALAEFRVEGLKGFWNWSKDIDSIDDFIQLTKDYEQGKGLPDGWVPSTTYWLIDGDQFIGHINIRHTLTDQLEKVGGHIGYAIRPSARNKGYGNKILELTLPKARELGLKKVLVTTDQSNIASQKIIKKNKGKFHDEVSGKTEAKLRYWIEL